MKFWEDSDRAMESFEIPSWFDFAKGWLRLRQGLAKDVDSYVCRLGNFDDAGAGEGDSGYAGWEGNSIFIDICLFICI